MEAQGGILSRVSEKMLGWIGLGALILLGIGYYQMDPETKQAIWDGIWKTVVGIILVGGLPWSAKLFIGQVIERSANWVSVALIGGFTLIDVIAAALLGAWPNGYWTALFALGALVGVGAYNYLVCEYLADMHGG